MGRNDEKSPFYEKVALLCSEAGTSISVLAEGVLGLSNTAATHWGKGKIPRTATVQRIATHFGVTAKYLRDDDIPIGTERPSTNGGATVHGKAQPAGNIESRLIAVIEDMCRDHAIQMATQQQIMLNAQELAKTTQKETMALIGEMEAQRISFDKKWAGLPMFAATINGEEDKKIPILAT